MRRRVCRSAGLGPLPKKRYVLPSMLAVPVRAFRPPVQCTVSASVSRSAGDQMLKYGSCATRGTEGGRT